MWLGTGRPDTTGVPVKRKLFHPHAGVELIGWRSTEADTVRTQGNAHITVMWHTRPLLWERVSVHLNGGFGYATAHRTHGSRTERGIGIAGGLGTDVRVHGHFYAGMRAKFVLQSLSGGHNAYLMLSGTLGSR